MLPGCNLLACHVHTGRIEPPVAESARYLISVRDPIDRVVSAFNWKHPGNGGGGGGRRKKSGSSSFLYRCFDTVDRFALGIKAADECGDTARKWLTEPHAHITMGLEFYLGAVLEAVLARPYFLLRTESYDRDIMAAAQWIGCTYRPRNRRKHSAYAMSNQTFLSPQGRASFREAFAREYDILEQLEAGAANPQGPTGRR